MKYTTVPLIALVGLSSAIPRPQFSIPGLGGASGGLPGLSPGGSGPGLGSGGGIPWLGPAGGLPGLGSGSDIGSGPDPGPESGSGSSSGQTPALPTSPNATAPPSGAAEDGRSECTPAAGGGATENGLQNKGCCTDMTIIFARGTGELGNVGTLSGPPMFKAIRSALGANRVMVQGVDYPASAAGNINQGADGGKIMASLVQTALSQCPDTKIIVSGYSQGSMVVHNAFGNGLSTSKVAGAVLFGDPLKRSPVGDMPANKVKQFCGTSDMICGGGGDGGATGSHISYGSSANIAASFAIQVAGLS
ncbi:hypothetical protein LEMA_P113170.1 [Plenodomus lingam JN3]|uniref:Cutinase n=2 Tax=Leptosphaeria maculans TaxID=5022 RepID=E4ZUW5_LEPMJ|nr:hypothetical protein LEMA_P113170.1 [Plenodomus lingam JN3]CBX94902.1 hypothetical protein LEMA_P113170.1 [Plenodomus lingam JN3]